MPMLITPKEPVETKAYKIPEDLPDLAKVCTPLGFTLANKWYLDPSPSAPDHILCAVTLRPTNGVATDQNTLKATEQDCITWDGINFVVKPYTEVAAVYDIKDAPPEPDPVPPTPAPEPEPEPTPDPDPEPTPEPAPETGPEDQGQP
ncbi:hypothetical protein [Mycobacterium sp. TY815]|uniref:hypothetical protein n=1 Tax=Mycobacterium sp. TY815 TaxID=3050581 RepID=UPI002741157A|nr:hypothetical protein [Mycobacterium sp. TY815]MDP7703170.1 hypothetical protein [Mycobacterium sp. TY815]